MAMHGLSRKVTSQSKEQFLAGCLCCCDALAGGKVLRRGQALPFFKPLLLPNTALLETVRCDVSNNNYISLLWASETALMSLLGVEPSPL